MVAIRSLLARGRSRPAGGRPGRRRRRRRGRMPGPGRRPPGRAARSRSRLQADGLRLHLADRTREPAVAAPTHVQAAGDRPQGVRQGRSTGSISWRTDGPGGPVAGAPGCCRSGRQHAVHPGRPAGKGKLRAWPDPAETPLPCFDTSCGAVSCWSWEWVWGPFCQGSIGRRSDVPSSRWEAPRPPGTRPAPRPGNGRIRFPALLQGRRLRSLEDAGTGRNPGPPCPGSPW